MIRTRTTMRRLPPRRPPVSFLERLGEPIDWLKETVFSILVLLAFTLAYRIFEMSTEPGQTLDAQYSQGLMIGVMEAILAWAVIEGVMYVVLTVFERNEKHRLLRQLHTASTHEARLQAIAEELDDTLEPITSLENRQQLYEDVLEHLSNSQPQPVRLTGEDVLHALGNVIVAIVAIVPSLLPIWILRNNFYLGIRISNTVSFLILFYAGYLWGKYSGSNPWKVGILMSVLGLILVSIAIVLGG